MLTRLETSDVRINGPLAVIVPDPINWGQDAVLVRKKA